MTQGEGQGDHETSDIPVNDEPISSIHDFMRSSTEHTWLWRGEKYLFPPKKHPSPCFVKIIYIYINVCMCYLGIVCRSAPRERLWVQTLHVPSPLIAFKKGTELTGIRVPFHKNSQQDALLYNSEKSISSLWWGVKGGKFESIPEWGRS